LTLAENRLAVFIGNGFFGPWGSTPRSRKMTGGVWFRTRVGGPKRKKERHGWDQKTGGDRKQSDVRGAGDRVHSAPSRETDLRGGGSEMGKGGGFGCERVLRRGADAGGPQGQRKFLVSR